MPEITLDLSDAAELAEMLAFLADWLSGSHKQALQDSLTAFAGHPACNTGTLCADLHRFTFLLGASDGEELFGERAPCFASDFVSDFPAPREAAMPSRNDGRNDTAIPCPACGQPFTPAGRRRWCSDACRQAAWRRRHPVQPPMAAPPPPQRPAREATVYECGDCGTRYLGQQRCADCGTFCRRIGPGGTCAACDEPVAISDLIATRRPGNIANRQSATPQENQ